MNEIFRKPAPEASQVEEHGVKILFLHGLEGNPSGKKASFLKEKWSALCPPLRTTDLVELKSAQGRWPETKTGQLEHALHVPYQDAKDAVRYSKPDIIVGSSMGGALLFKLISEGLFEGTGVFLAPAVTNLLDNKLVLECVSSRSEVLKQSIWLLGETDTVVSNDDNFSIARSVGASVIFSPNDSHRLNKAVSTNILDSTILTAIETHGRR